MRWIIARGEHARDPAWESQEIPQQAIGLRYDPFIGSAEGAGGYRAVVVEAE